MNEIKIDAYTVGRTLNMRVVHDKGDFYHVATDNFETYGADGHAASEYNIAMTAKGGGVYRGNWPAAINLFEPDADYMVQIWDAAISTQPIATKEIHIRDGAVVELTDIVEAVDNIPAGTGFYTWPYTLTVQGTGAPLAGASVWVTTDLAGQNVVANGTTTTFGVVTFYLNTGTYYLWRALAGYRFTNATRIVVPTETSGSGTGVEIAAGGGGAITKASIVALCNKAFETSEDDDSTLFDVALQMALDDLSRIGILRDTYAAVLGSGDYQLAQPSDLMPGGLISITLTDDAGNAYAPLRPFTGGLREYRQLIRQNNNVDRPCYYVEGEDGTWYLWRPANGDYDVLIEYYQVHPQGTETIWFPAACAMAVRVGTAYFESVLRRNDKYQAVWAPLYARAYEAVRGMYPGEPYGIYP